MKRFFCLLTLLTVLVACGGGSSSGPTADDNSNAVTANGTNVQGMPSGLGTSNSQADANVIDLIVDGGPDGSQANLLYASVTICKPGSTSLCKTIDHVLVDTGSVGLRLLATAVPADLQLPAAKNAKGNVLLGCANFLDYSFAWGPLALADVKLGGMTATNTPVHLVGHADYVGSQANCSSGNAIVSASDLGANGILGVGLSQQDCGSICETLGGSGQSNGKYFACTNFACSIVTNTPLASDKQLQQVIARFPTDNNGFAIQMDSVRAAGAMTLAGKMVFGLGTRSNNQFPNFQVLATRGQGLLTGALRRDAWAFDLRFSSAFLDTGSNGIYFDTYDIVDCLTGVAKGFYCPRTELVFGVTLEGAYFAQVQRSFTIANAANLFQTGRAALPGLGGPINASGLLDLGSPFFYGRTVVLGIEGRTSTGVGASLATGPFYAL